MVTVTSWSFMLCAVVDFGDLEEHFDYAMFASYTASLGTYRELFQRSHGAAGWQK